MKKVFAILLALAMLCVLGACDEGNTQCNHDWKDATCLAPKTCSKCGAMEGSAAGHTLTAVCATCGQNNEGFVEVANHSWGYIEIEDGHRSEVTCSFLEESMDVSYTRYVTLEKMAEESESDIETLREEYEEYDMLEVFDGVEYVYNGWGMDNWSARKYTEENGVITIQFLSLNWNEADEEVWTVAKTAILTRTGLTELTVTGGDYCEIGVKLTAKQ